MTVVASGSSSKHFEALKQIRLLDLDALHAPIQPEIDAALAAVIASQQYILGPAVGRLESWIAGYCGVPHAVGCASGSDALYLALLALDIGPGDEVIVPAFTFFATAGAVTRIGATPVFVDIDPVTYNLDPQRLGDALGAHPAAKAVIAVHLYGGAADLTPILQISRAHGVPVIEDGAQAIGAEYKGRRVLSEGLIGCLSFFPTKNLGALGDAGMLTTNDPELAEKLAALRVHGGKIRYRHDWVGINSRLDTLQAAALLVKAQYLDAWTAARQENARQYQDQLRGCGVSLPEIAPYQTRHVFNQFVIRSPRRDELRAYLQERGVGTEVYYPIPLHLQPCYDNLGIRDGALPVSEKASREVLALPIHPTLSNAEVEYVSEQVREFCKAGN